ncbi:RNase P modulator RnpM [Paraliobacillus sediminis]|uniref:RNase P modulator RnpM n=1 Tax=Paraliobacillus sediminis TaxID=1885916 RepID=UPI000E3C1D66|nr:YlxR family protein [Paraliobacillus sediminis]
MPKKNNKIPLRKCIVTQEMKPKQALIRIVHNKDGEVFVDPSGKKNGRGAYISNSLEVVEKAEKSKVLDRHLQTNVDETVYQQLKQVIEGKDIE